MRRLVAAEAALREALAYGQAVHEWLNRFGMAATAEARDRAFQRYVAWGATRQRDGSGQ